MEVITWLNSNSGAITAIATVVLVGITAFYAWVTRQMRLDAQKPEIAIYLRLEKTDLIPKKMGIFYIYLYVENIGMGPARDVKFSIDPSFNLPGDKSLREVSFLELGIGYLPPGHQRKCFLANQTMTGFSELMRKQLKITATYKGATSRKYENPVPLDFREHSGK